jgi:hypothetical protein
MSVVWLTLYGWIIRYCTAFWSLLLATPFHDGFVSSIHGVPSTTDYLYNLGTDHAQKTQLPLLMLERVYRLHSNGHSMVFTHLNGKMFTGSLPSSSHIRHNIYVHFKQRTVLFLLYNMMAFKSVPHIVLHSCAFFLSANTEYWVHQNR